MLVGRDNFYPVANEFIETGRYGLDVETTGLRYTDRLFSIQLAAEDKTFYFNFQMYPELDKDYRGLIHPVVLFPEHLRYFQKIFENPDSTFFAHNAKFELTKLMLENIEVKSKVWCTQIGSRLVNNLPIGHGLDASGKRIGYEKDKSVEEYIKKHKLWAWEKIPYKKTRRKNLFYYKVPLDIIQKYGEIDAEITRGLGVDQVVRMKKRMAFYASNNHLCQPNFKTFLEVERDISKVVAEMYHRGAKVDLEFTNRALQEDLKVLEETKKEYIRTTGIEYENGEKHFNEVFDLYGIKKEFTKKGQLKKDEPFFKRLDHPISPLVLKIRKHDKRICTYFSNITYFADDGIIHPNLLPYGTVTGRFSSNEPNLQNIPRNDAENEDMSVKKCFIPREDHVLVMIDYDQQELKLLFDYANERGVIQRILAGEDAHQVTADLAGIGRKEAKAVNFGLLYGMGVEALALTLGVTVSEAKFLKNKHLSSLAAVRQFVARVMDMSVKTGFITNWAGRRLHLPNRDMAYVMMNHLIQSSGADVCRKAMVETWRYLQPYRSALLLQVHDEIIFEIHKDELHLVDNLKKIMEDAYPPRNGLPLTCSVEYSLKSWGDKQKWPNQKHVSKIEQLVA